MTHKHGAKTQLAMIRLILVKVGKLAAKPLTKKQNQVATSFSAPYIYDNMLEIDAKISRILLK